MRCDGNGFSWIFFFSDGMIFAFFYIGCGMFANYYWNCCLLLKLGLCDAAD